MGVLEGQSALVTGGGSGIGLGCARALVRDGAAVVIAGRSADRLAAAADELGAIGTGDGSGEVVTVVCDVTDEQQVETACAAADAAGRFTMVVANAGFGTGGPFHLIALDEWNRVLGTNLTGAFLTMKHAVPYLARSGGGSIVAVSSIAAPLTHRYMTPYSVSKAGLEMLTKQVADECGVVGIRANAVRPGLVPTEATSAMVSMEDIKDDYLAQMPLDRLGTEDDVAALVRFLLGPESSWITGQCIGVDGGHTLRRGPDIGSIMGVLFGDQIHPG